MGKFERDFFERHSEIEIFALVEGWEGQNGLINKAEPLSVEERWHRFLRLTQNMCSNDNHLFSTYSAAAKAMVKA